VEHPILVSGIAIPIGNQYRYLGLEFHSTLSLKHAAIAIAESVKEAVDACRLFISDHDIPLHLRIVVARAKIWARAAYGGELLGMRDPKLAEPVDKALTVAARLLTYGRGKAKMSKYQALLLELGLPSAQAQWDGSRARAMAKFPTLKTVIAGLCTNGDNEIDNNSWMAGAESYTKSMIQWYEGVNGQGSAVDEEGKGLFSVNQPSKLGRTVRTLSGQRESIRLSGLDDKGGTTLDRYMSAGFQHTRGYVTKALADPGLTHGFKWVTRLRTQQFWFTPRLIKAGMIPHFKLKGSNANRQCMCCDLEIEDNLVHLLCRCKTFKSERDQYLKEITLQLKQQWFGSPHGPGRTALAEIASGASATPADESQAFLALSLLGTGAGGRFWAAGEEASAPSTANHDLLSTGNGAGAANDSKLDAYTVLRATAQFLQAVMPIRMNLFKRFSTDGHTGACSRRLGDRYGSSGSDT
jgi:hypothetical protein